MDILVRTAVVSDAAAVASIDLRGWQTAYADIISPDFLAALPLDKITESWTAGISAGTMSDGGRIFVAEFDRKVLGWMTCGASRDEDAPSDVGELHGVYVDPQAWGQGIGSALMAECLTQLRSQGYCRATLWVFADNDSTRGWYERQGWRPDGTESLFPIAGTELPVVRYELPLTT